MKIAYLATARKQLFFKSSTKETHVEDSEKAKDGAEFRFSKPEGALTTQLAKEAKGIARFLQSSRIPDWIFFIALITAVFLVYQPAWQGGFIWDDDRHVTSPELRSW